MLKLEKVKIYKYKSFVEEQEVRIADNVTVLIGKNESGKTAFLESLAKVNYFEKDSRYKLNIVADYPRNQLSRFLNSETDQECVRCTFRIDDALIEKIENDLGKGVFLNNRFTYGISYKGKTTWFDLKADETKFLEYFFEKYDMSDRLRSQLERVTNVNELIELWKEKKADDVLTRMINDLTQNYISKGYNWGNKIKGYLAKYYLKPAIPKFWYFDEFYSLPSRISINDLRNKELDDDSLKISRAFFELANISVEELLQSEDYESYLANIEATANAVTNEIFRYWSTDRDLEIKFEIESKAQERNKILDIRIRNSRRKVTLPLKNRSKGLNTFFSFIVWFSRIKNDKNSNFILLLDEPGLNLHSTAQADMLRFIEDLSINHQIIYTTHSPFMINPHKMDRVRTVSDKGLGSIISEIEMESDSETLYPLKASIGFNMVDHLLKYDKNLIVENSSTMVYLDIMSGILKSLNRKGLGNGITIVPIGGMDKLLSFTSLLRSEKSDFLCLIASSHINNTFSGDLPIFETSAFSDTIFTYDEFCSAKEATIEDLFETGEFLKLYNAASGKTEELEIEPPVNEPILQILCKKLNGQVDSYRIAYKLANWGLDADFFSPDTLTRFEKLFSKINLKFDQ